ncbi:MAG TPA: flavin reductase family protein [Bacteroidota bacterium]|nr:flavin reductase family protein [Bacteroidota bacterium]
MNTVPFPLDPKSFRQTIGQFATGVAVIATDVENHIHAMTVGSLTSLSLEPMLVLFCLDKRAKMAEVIEHAVGFSVNILRDEQQALSTYFAGGWKEQKAPPFRFVPWQGGPRLEGCAAALGCSKYHAYDGGDHRIVIGKVEALHQGVEPRRPLIFHASMYATIDRRNTKPAPELEGSNPNVPAFLDPWKEE